jgi:hypothetical protein
MATPFLPVDDSIALRDYLVLIGLRFKPVRSSCLFLCDADSVFNGVA